MEAVYELNCSFCNVSGDSVTALYHHVRSKGHRTVLQREAPGKLQELGRLQYYLDTHLWEEPVLGLEYIMEERVKYPYYNYKCYLCHVGGPVLVALKHLLSKRHLVTYLTMHHEEVVPERYSDGFFYNKILKDVALMIQERYGRKKIQIKNSTEVDTPLVKIQIKNKKKSKVGPPFVKTQIKNKKKSKVGPPLVKTQIKNKKTKVGPPFIKTQIKNKKKTKVGPPLVFGWSAKSFQSCTCNLCNVIFPVGLLRLHVKNKRHRINMQRISPVQKSQLGRLQYFLDTHLGEEPVLGLEYIVEEFTFCLHPYRYTCQLCQARGSWNRMVSHIMSSGHMAQYIDKHHSELSLSGKTYASKDDFLRDLRQCALTIWESDGKKQVQVKQPEFTSPALALELPQHDGEQNGDLPSQDASHDLSEGTCEFAEEDHCCSADTEPQPSPQHEKEVNETATVQEVESRGDNDSLNWFKKPKIQQCVCDLCNESTSSAVKLCEHIVGWDHKMNLWRATSKQPKEKDRLQYILDTHMKEEAILGLEYIEEREKGSSSYSYTCCLCDLQASLSDTLKHILEKKHLKCYIDKHFRELLPENDSNLSLYNKALTEVALAVQEKYGRKEILFKTNDDSAKEALPFKIKTLQQFEFRRSDNFVHDEKKIWTWSHSLSEAPFSVKDLNKHFMGKAHRMDLESTTSEQVKELGQLQHFLDTHLKEEPVLGLEYIEEEFVFAFPPYKYTCQLCNVEGTCQTMVVHIMSSEHMTSYIDKHHSDLSLSEKTYRFKDDLLRDLRQCALTICESDGKKEVQVKKPDTIDLVLARQLPNQDVNQNGDLPSQDTVAEEEGSYLKDQRPQPFSQHKKELNESALVHEVKSDRDHDFSDCLKKTEIQMLSCSHCDVTFSVMNLEKHFMEKEHRMNLERSAVEQVNELGSLKYLLNMYLKDCPLLGLEYILEMEVDSVYQYTCMLCNVEADWCQTFIHITGDDHLARYINRHHHELSIKPDMLPPQQDYSKALRETSFQIYKKYGCKEIRIKMPIVVNPEDDSNGESAQVPQLHQTQNPENDEIEKEPSASERKEVLNLSWNDNSFPGLCCDLCGIALLPCNMECHLMGKKHKKKLLHSAHGQVNELGSLRYLLDVYLKDYPLLGLEYIVEMQEKNSMYQYTCSLCNVEGNCYRTLIHITSKDHVVNYIRLHHQEMVLNPSILTRKEYNTSLRASSIKICKKYGRKEIQIKTPDVVNPASVEVIELPPEDKSDGDETLLPKPNGVGEEASDSKKGLLQSSSERDIILEETSPIQELEFRRNDDFLDYLRNFVIEDSEDASFIQQIIQNCITGLLKFREEVQKGPSEQLQAQPASRTVNEDTDISVNKTDSCFLDPQNGFT